VTKGTLLGTAPIVNGSASLTLSLRKGSHPLTAGWAGDANFTGSNAAMTHQVNEAALARLETTGAKPVDLVGQTGGTVEQQHCVIG